MSATGLSWALEIPVVRQIGIFADFAEFQYNTIITDFFDQLFEFTVSISPRGHNFCKVKAESNIDFVNRFTRQPIRSG